MSKKPTWIGLHIPLSVGYIRVCIGLNLEDGNEVSFYNDADYEVFKEHGEPPWCYGNQHLGEIKMTVKEGATARVFDDKHQLIEDQDGPDGPEPLTQDELDKIAEICSGIEVHEYRTGGWKWFSGGFAICEMTDYSDHQIYLELKSGVQSDCENRTYYHNITLDRKTMEIIKD